MLGAKHAGATQPKERGKRETGVVLRASEHFPKLLPFYPYLSENQAVVQLGRNF